ncbi:glycoside hydrolase family 65 protein [Streptococcus parauberis]|uniref:glycoside hydrolase family 65 protein n=1 Tax=Streptococcus parauberis TaxID=1348 RepID=UPI000E30429B|nr:glycosyl hydrolase family 65 protein [Streptococcus parauberis]RFE01032.1 Kojibiose phosphorylase [Streptococcus parauberis]
MSISYENSFTITENNFDGQSLGKVEAVFSLGNGYLGTRSSLEEKYPNEKRGTFIAGTFNQFDLAEVTELPNFPDVWNMEFSINGQRFHLETGKILDYKRSINYKTGELSRRVTWEKDDYKLSFQFTRFVSKKQLHLLASKVIVTNLSDQPIEVELYSGINGQVTNSGTQHFSEGRKLLVEQKYLQSFMFTSESKISAVVTTEHRFSKQPKKARPETARRGMYARYFFDLDVNETQEIEKISSYFTTNDFDFNSKLDEQSIIFHKQLENSNYDSLFKESAKAWESVWNHHPIVIDSSDMRDQLAINFAKYHLHVMTPAHDERMNIAAKGLSGEGYKGHTFWDTEIFMLPYFTYTFPKIARSLEKYRYLGLEGAHVKAESNGYKGAQFPWESANPNMGEVTPIWGAADIITGKETKIWSGFIEQHITSDVAYGVKQYIDVTGDQEFAESYGYEILLDTAKFWASRFEFDSKRSKYVITDVIGPDEYKEHVDNNAFTNYTAHWNIQYALNLAKELATRKPSLYNRLHQKVDLDTAIKEWEELLPLIYLPEPTNDGIIPEEDKYLDKKIIDLTPYKEEAAVGTLFHDYNLEQVNEMQVTKQADVLLLLFLFENLFDKDIKEKNWHYYEPKTTHDSSLSLSTHALLAADLGLMEKSYQLFKEACEIDMGEYMHSSDEGIHAASTGGIWNAVIFGYGGLRVLDGKLRIEPNLPKEWNSLNYEIEFQSAVVKVEVTKESVTISTDREISFEHKGKMYSVQNTITL